MYAEHFRTNDNFSKYGFSKTEEINKKITTERITSMDRSDIKGYRVNSFGIFVKE